jgi:plasmid maintenance system antidote protein VapI
VARGAALSAGYLSELVNGSKGASPATARRLAEVLSCSVQTLFPELAVVAA